MTTQLEICPLRRYMRHGMLPQLAAFEAVVRLGSATHAAAALCIAQPTLSGHLRKLSEALGVRLFETQGKRLVPTDAALVLLQAARDVFAAFTHCEQLLAELRAVSRPNAPASDATLVFARRIGHAATPQAPPSGSTPHAGLRSF
jgi:DNA-binding transcriptional LysR family regulator